MENQDMMSLNKQIKSCDLKKPFVFVSYSKKDAIKVYPTVITLQQKGFNVWIDKELSNQIGMDWQLGALKAIASRECKAILFFMSENSMWSAPVCAELVWSTSETTRRYNRNEALKIIPINTSDLWNPSKEATCTWIRDTLADGGGEEQLEDADYDVLRAAEVEERYLDTKNISHYRYHSDIALHIQKMIFDPLGGNKVTIASLSDIDTIQSNIPGETKSDIIEKKDSTTEAVEPESKFESTIIANHESDKLIKIAEVIDIKPDNQVKKSEIIDKKSDNQVKKSEIISSKSKKPVMKVDSSSVKPEKFTNITEVSSEKPLNEKANTLITENTTLAEFEKMCLDVDFCLYLRNIRGAHKELYSKQIFDYVVVAILRGCDDKVQEGSAPWNYCIYTVAANPNPENPVLGASQFTWQSNSRKAVNMTGSGKLGANSTYFKTLNPNTTLSEIQHNFEIIPCDAYITKNNVMIPNVFSVLYGQI